MVLEASPSAREAYSLLQAFRRILTERRANALRSWLEQAARSSLAPLRGFARSLEQDMDAVMNALTYPWSNGRVEGYINKLKQLKRQMYGRAGIGLLRRRFRAMGRGESGGRSLIPASRRPDSSASEGTEFRSGRHASKLHLTCGRAIFKSALTRLPHSFLF